MLQPKSQIMNPTWLQLFNFLKLISTDLPRVFGSPNPSPRLNLEICGHLRLAVLLPATGLFLHSAGDYWPESIYFKLLIPGSNQKQNECCNMLPRKKCPFTRCYLARPISGLSFDPYSAKFIRLMIE
jgi:hypothetical protein